MNNTVDSSYKMGITGGKSGANPLEVVCSLSIRTK